MNKYETFCRKKGKRAKVRKVKMMTMKKEKKRRPPKRKVTTLSADLNAAGANVHS